MLSLMERKTTRTTESVIGYFSKYSGGEQRRNAASNEPHSRADAGENRVLKGEVNPEHL